jgi:hypothetical protein
MIPGPGPVSEVWVSEGWVSEGWVSEGLVVWAGILRGAGFEPSIEYFRALGVV